MAVFPEEGQPLTEQPRPPMVPSTWSLTPLVPSSACPKPAKLTVAPMSLLVSPSEAGRFGMGAASVTSAPSVSSAMSPSLEILL